MKIPSNMMKYLRFLIILAVFPALFISCGKGSEKSAGNVTSTIGDASDFAKSKLGESTKLVYKGDMTGNNREDALALVIIKEYGENRYWIQKGTIIEKGLTGWNTLLEMGEVLKTPKGQMTEQQQATNGYIVSFKTEEKPMNLYISIANADGRPSSDEAVIKWNQKDSIYEFKAGYEDSAP
jgi:hypothetical protein